MRGKRINNLNKPRKVVAPISSGSIDAALARHEANKEAAIKKIAADDFRAKLWHEDFGALIEMILPQTFRFKSRGQHPPFDQLNCELEFFDNFASTMPRKLQPVYQIKLKARRISDDKPVYELTINRNHNDTVIKEKDYHTEPISSEIGRKPRKNKYEKKSTSVPFSEFSKSSLGVGLMVQLYEEQLYDLLKDPQYQQKVENHFSRFWLFI